MIFMSLGGFWLQFPGHRMCFVFWTGPIAGPGRQRRNIFPLFSLEQPDWYAASSPAVPYSSWEELGTKMLCLTQLVLKNKGCVYMRAQCHGCHSAGPQWTFGAWMNNFILNNSSRQPEDPSQLAASFTALRGERSTVSTWNIRREKIIENSGGSLTFASSPTGAGSGMPKSQQRDTFLQLLSALVTQHTSFHVQSHRNEERKKDIVWLLSILARTGAQILRTETREIIAALMYL